jgi:hypothetical protein
MIKKKKRYFACKMVPTISHIGIILFWEQLFKFKAPNTTIKIGSGYINNIQKKKTTLIENT